MAYSKTIKLKKTKWYTGVISLLIAFAIYSCDHKDFLTREPSNIISTKDLFSNPELVKSNIADLYSDIIDWNGIQEWWKLTVFNNSVFPSNSGNYWLVRNRNIAYNFLSVWDYGYLHDINLFLDRINAADQLDSDQKTRFIGEALFLRANFYFKEVRTMGGVPIILDTLEYNFSGDASYLYRERAPEASVYDLVIREADSAAQMLPKDPSIKSRATWGAAMTLKSRAALFAGSIAQHGANTPSVSLPSHIVGIPADRAKYYYKIALEAAQKIITSERYHLYMRYPDSLQKNFAHLFLDKNNNPEVIFAEDFKTGSKVEVFTVRNQPHSTSEEASQSGMANPTLNFVQSFERLDNTFAPFKIKNPDGSYVKYDHKSDIFKGRDARLGGTVILPGTKFRGQDLDIWAGYYLPKKPEGDRIITGSQFGQKKILPGQSDPEQVVGFDGPIDGAQHGTQTGFYMRKYLDPTPGAGTLGLQSDVWWVRMRYAEVLLNAAEAAFQLGKKELATKYINQVRSRAGFKVPLTQAQITFNRIAHERLIELAFEGHKLWDVIRWRQAHRVWNGRWGGDLSDPSNPWLSSTQPWGLWPYKVYDPGQPDNGKWIYKRVLPGVVGNQDNFRLGNYYSAIPGSALSKNPKLIPNPNQ